MRIAPTSDVMLSGLAGMQLASNALGRAAEQVSRASGGFDGDLEGAVVSSIGATATFGASLAMVKAADEQLASLVNLFDR